MDAATSDIRAVEFTSSSEGDSPVLRELLDQIPQDEQIGTVTGPSRACKHALPGSGMVPMTPGDATQPLSNVRPFGPVAV